MILLTAALTGCGTTQQRTGTEQLLLSDSVDRAIDQIDFAPLAGRKVYLDTTYLKAIKGTLFVNADYIVSGLRQKLTVSGCQIQDKRDSADYIVEARVGALGTDGLEITYGIPASNAVSAAASLVSSVPAMPTIPEISFGKRNASLSTSKIVAYAYHRETGTAVWQSGTAVAKSDAKHSWVLGAGPLQYGSIYDETSFAGLKIKSSNTRSQRCEACENGNVCLARTHQFVSPDELEEKLAEAKAANKELKVLPASHSQ